MVKLLFTICCTFLLVLSATNTLAAKKSEAIKSGAEKLESEKIEFEKREFEKREFEKKAPKKIAAAKEDLGDIKEKIEALKKELDSNQAAQKDATDALKESETAISESNLKLHEINQKQKQNKNQLAQLKSQSLSLNARLKQQQAELAGLIRQQYKHGKQSYTQLILQNKNPHDVPRQLKYFSYIAKARAQLIDDMQGNLTQVARLNDKTTATLQQVVALKNKQELEKKQLQAQSREKSKVVKGLSSQIAAQRNEIDKLKRDEKSLFNLVERLAKIVPPKKHISKKANNKKQKTNTNTNTSTSNEDEANKENASVVATNETLPNTDVTGIHFANLRGKLRLPVRGEVSNRFGSNRADTGVSWKGLFIRAAEGNEVKTVADGRVVFADWMRGFGNLIIIDHGSGYMSLYGNNQAVLKRVGDDVDAGDAIASVGNTGGNESNGLYYELRHNSQPFDPMQWSER